jgi:hypothetical protein
LVLQVAEEERPSLSVLWVLDIDPTVIGIAPEAEAELLIMRNELKNRNVIVQLSSALRTGMAVGDVGALDTACIDVSMLDSAIAYALRIGCQTVEASQFLDTAQFVRRLRAAFIAGDWLRLEQVLTDMHGRVLADIVADEVVAAQYELDNRAILMELGRAVATGCVQLSNGKLYAGYVDVNELGEAISLATRLGPRTPEAKLMLLTAKAVRRLRQLVQTGDFNEANITLQSIKGRKMASVAMNEIRMIQDGVDNWVSGGAVAVTCAVCVLLRCLCSVLCCMRAVCLTLTVWMHVTDVAAYRVQPHSGGAAGRAVRQRGQHRRQRRRGGGSVPRHPGRRGGGMLQPRRAHAAEHGEAAEAAADRARR